MKQLTDVWTLETGDEEAASEDLNFIIANAMGRVKNSFDNRMQHIKYLRTLWDGESWESIKKKLSTEGSVWIVWYWDGLNQHIRNLMRQRMKDEDADIIEESKLWNEITIQLRGGEIAIILKALNEMEAHGTVLKVATKDLINRIVTAQEG